MRGLRPSSRSSVPRCRRSRSSALSLGLGFCKLGLQLLCSFACNSVIEFAENTFDVTIIFQIVLAFLPISSVYTF